MILASPINRASRLAAVGLAAMLFAGCTSIPTLTPSPTPAPPGSPSAHRPGLLARPHHRSRLPDGRPRAVHRQGDRHLQHQLREDRGGRGRQHGPQRGRSLRGPCPVRLLQQRDLPSDRPAIRDPGRRRRVRPSSPNLNTSRMGQGGPTLDDPGRQGEHRVQAWLGGHGQYGRGQLGQLAVLHRSHPGRRRPPRQRLGRRPQVRLLRRRHRRHGRGRSRSPSCRSAATRRHRASRRPCRSSPSSSRASR